MKNEVFEDYMELTAKQFAVMNYRYTMISGIIPIVEDKKKLAAAVKRTAEEYGVSKPTVRNYLKAYLKDRDKRVLAPVIREAKAMENKYAFDIRWALNKYYYTRDKRSLSDVYTLLIKERFYKDGALLEDRPTYSQFLYYYNKHKSTTNKIISRQGLSYFQRNERPLLGDGVQEYCNAIGIGMLDSTVADIYLINEAGQLVGRPTITVCVDAYSGLCCGYSLGWEGGNFALRNLMQNIISDKVAYCRGFGIEIMDKARIFKFRIDDNHYNLQLHGLVLKELGLNLYGAEVYEDYQSIYEETMKKTEKRNSDDERRYDDKKWERGR